MLVSMCERPRSSSMFTTHVMSKSHTNRLRQADRQTDRQTDAPRQHGWQWDD